MDGRRNLSKRSLVKLSLALGLAAGQLPHFPKVNLVHNQELIERWRHGEAYDLEFIFHARRWVGGADLLGAETVRDRSGREVAVLDLEHNRPLYDSLSACFFRAFNSWKVWKEGDVPLPP